MVIHNSFIQNVVNICNSSHFLIIHEYDDHLSYVYPSCIIKIYSERIFVLYISEDGNHDEDIIKISEIDCLKDIIDNYSYNGHITSQDTYKV